MDKLNQWLTLVANLGVIAGLVFVGIEVRQNTLAIERELATSFADNVHGTLANSDHLTAIAAKIMKHEGGAPTLLKALGDEYDLTEIETQRWWRHLMQIWLRSQADWVYRGRDPDDCEHEGFLMQFRDNQILITAIASNHQFEAEYIQCVQQAVMRSVDS